MTAGCCIINHNIILCNFQLAGYIIKLLLMFHRFNLQEISCTFLSHYHSIKFSALNYPTALNVKTSRFIAFLWEKDVLLKGDNWTLWITTLATFHPFKAPYNFFTLSSTFLLFESTRKGQEKLFCDNESLRLRAKIFFLDWWKYRFEDLSWKKNSTQIHRAYSNSLFMFEMFFILLFSSFGIICFLW